MRRKNLGPQCQGEKPDPNNLLAFLYDLAACTKSLLLATATGRLTVPAGLTKPAMV
jgi:hypothetical protein